MEISTGDKIYHKSTPNIIWVVEKIKDNEAYCSTLIPETCEKKEAKFLLPTIAKVTDSGGGFYISKGRNNHY